MGQPPHQVAQDRHGDQDRKDATKRIGRGILEALAFAGDRHIEDDAEPQGFNKANSGDGKEDAAEPQHGQSNEKADETGQQRAGEHVQGKRRGQVEAHQDGRISADRHEARVGERQLAGVEGDEDRDGEDRIDADLGNQQLVLVVEADRVGEQLDEKVHARPKGALQSLAQPGPEESLGADHQHHEERGKGHPRGDIAAESDEGEHLDQAEHVTTQDGPGDAAHAAQDDDGEPLQLHLVAADVGADVRNRQSEEQPGEATQRRGDEQGRGEDPIDVDPEQGRSPAILRHRP